MAPTHKSVAAVVAVDSYRNVELARRAAALLVRLEPRANPQETVRDLLDRLKSEKSSRESRGLNHWSEHAPKFIGGLVRQARRDKALRFQEAEAFYRARHREVLRFARVIVQDGAAAETVASDTYRELLEGRTTVANFFSALVGNARNYLEGEAYRRDRFAPQDGAFTSDFAGAELEGGEGDAPSFEPASRRPEDQDPLDILIAREEEEERRRMLTNAKRDPRWRYIKLRDWAAPLRENVRN
jgi:hypothetical protein